MLLFSAVLMMVSTYLVFSRKVRTDIIMIHLLGFSAISFGVHLFAGSINALLSGVVLFIASGIYWTASELFCILEKIEE
jgi:hypothetical protein